MWSLREQVPLSNLNTFKIGGLARYFITIRSRDELSLAVEFAKKNKLKILILGEGSNILVSDSGFDGLVIKNEIKGIEKIKTKEDDHSVTLRVGSGELLDSLVFYTVENLYWGIENLSGIPGTVGATPVQNVGAYGVEIADVIESVETVSLNTDEEKIFKKEECQFGYRQSFFKSELGKDYFITAVNINLSLVEKRNTSYNDLKDLREEASIREIREAVVKIRNGKFPDWTKEGTAGSFFKNPKISQAEYAELKADYPDLPGYQNPDGSIKVPLGYILDKVCNLKGYRQGKVRTYESQALVVVADRGASAEEIKNFARDIQKKVFEKTKIKIEWEVTEIKNNFS